VTPAPSYSYASEVRELAQSAIDRDPSLCPRRDIDDSRIALFRELLAESTDALPPVLVVPCEDRYLLADGWHRLGAYDGLTADMPLMARVVDVGDRDPRELTFELALREAAKSARPLSNDERKAAALRLVQERSDLAQGDIAQLVGVSQASTSRWVAAQQRQESSSSVPPEEDAWAVALRGLRLLARALDLDDEIPGEVLADYLARASDKRAALRGIHAWASAMLRAAQQALEPASA